MYTLFPLSLQDLVSSGVTDDILCDVGMPVMHRGGSSFVCSVHAVIFIMILQLSSS